MEGLSRSIAKDFREKRRERKRLSKKADVKQPRERRDTCKRYTVKMFTPEIRGVKFSTSDELRQFMKTELYGMTHLPEYEKLMHNAEAQLKLKGLIGNRKELSLSEIHSLSEQTDLPFRTTRHYTYKEGRPQLYRLAENAITRTEAKTTIKKMRSEIGDLKSQDDVIRKLQDKGLLEHLEGLKSHEQNDKMVRGYFEFLELLSEGGLITDIARRLEVSDGTAIQWKKGVLPDYIRRSLEDSDYSDSHEIERHGGRVMMQRPEIRGIPIESEAHLKKLIDEGHAGLKDMPGFDKMLHEACVHIRLVNELQNREYLEYGEVPHLANEYDVKAGTLGTWITKEVTPRLYFHLERTVSKSEASERFGVIQEQNNGVMSVDEFNWRIKNYYLRKEWQESSFYDRDLDVMQKYSAFMNRYTQGGSLKHIALQAGVPTSTAQGWLDGLQPRPVRIASGLPRETPKEGHEWLPLRFVDGRYPKDCIQVPVKINSHKEVIEVLKQLTPVDNRQMREWKVKYGRLPIEEEFMFALGAYISDAGIFSKTTLAQSIGIRLAKRYSWSKNFGEGLCHALGVCGIEMHRNENTPAKTAYKKERTGIRKINQSEKLNWGSEHSPLAVWMHRTCLGYRSDIPKREQAVDAEWILKAPYPMRRAILQGLGDGDGSASVKGNYVCISSKNNKPFIHNLLGTFGIETRFAPKDVVTKGGDEAMKAAKIPLFRYAKSRLDASEQIIRRNDSRRDIRLDPLQKDEIDFILSMKRRGLSDWETSEAFLERFGTTIDKRSIGRLYRREMSK